MSDPRPETRFPHGIALGAPFVLCLVAFGSSEQQPPAAQAQVQSVPDDGTIPALAPIVTVEGVRGWARIGQATDRAAGLPTDPRLRDATPAGGVCYQPCWGPGNPIVYSMYFNTLSDYAQTNAVHIGAGATVPRNAFLFEVDAYFYNSFTSPSYPGSPDTWYLYYLNGQNQVMYWLRVVKWFRDGPFYVSDSNGWSQWPSIEMS